MNHTYKVLSTDMDFLKAALIRICVSVWHVLKDQETIIDYGGIIEGDSPRTVKIAGKSFFRETFEFRTLTNEMGMQSK